MGKHSSIEWTHHTFNPWWGCEKISPACAHCYAETWAKRCGSDVWGKASERRFFGDHHWNEPLRWQRSAAQAGTRERVFCASMADVFENRRDLDASRERLWQLIEATPNLDWLLLTKRPENLLEYAPWTAKWPDNIWAGTTVENQECADLRLPYLLAVPTKVRFLSCEPLLGSVNLKPWLSKRSKFYPIDWVIAGGESGGNARPMNPDWVTDLRDQCTDADISFHFKQWGHWAPANQVPPSKKQSLKLGRNLLVAAGKKAAGRKLEGLEWNELPML